MATEWGEKNCTYVKRPSADWESDYKECDHEWSLDEGSGMNTVKGPWGTYGDLLELRMECRICDTAIWVKQTEVCDSNKGHPLSCVHCHESEPKCECLWCDDCDGHKDDCICPDEHPFNEEKE
jgi:hypothetical protein